MFGVFRYLMSEPIPIPENIFSYDTKGCFWLCMIYYIFYKKIRSVRGFFHSRRFEPRSFCVLWCQNVLLYPFYYVSNSCNIDNHIFWGFLGIFPFYYIERKKSPKVNLGLFGSKKVRKFFSVRNYVLIILILLPESLRPKDVKYFGDFWGQKSSKTSNRFLPFGDFCENRFGHNAKLLFWYPYQYDAKSIFHFFPKICLSTFPFWTFYKCPFFKSWPISFWEIRCIKLLDTYYFVYNIINAVTV